MDQIGPHALFGEMNGTGRMCIISSCVDRELSPTTALSSWSYRTETTDIQHATSIVSFTL